MKKIFLFIVSVFIAVGTASAQQMVGKIARPVGATVGQSVASDNIAAKIQRALLTILDWEMRTKQDPKSIRTLANIKSTTCRPAYMNWTRNRKPMPA